MFVGFDSYLTMTLCIVTYTICVEPMIKMTSGSATDHNTTAVARPRDNAQDEDARANINVVLSIAYRQQQHGQHQLMLTLPPSPGTTTPGQTSPQLEEIPLLT